MTNDVSGRRNAQPTNQTLLSTTLAGVTASLVESYVLYPLEYLKVREQIAIRPRNFAEKFSIPNFSAIFFKGSSAFAMGNATKAVLRFNVYNWATKFMVGDSSTGTAPQLVVAGIMTGVVETLAVVPFENIKTTMIEQSALGKGRALGCLPIPGSPEAAGVSREIDQDIKAREIKEEHGEIKGRKIRPQAPIPPASKVGLYEVAPLRSLHATVRHMFEQRGARAFIQGFNPTVFRQIANSGIRFTTYNALRQLFVPNNENISLVMSIGLAGAASMAEALATQPIDVIKTRMQTTNGIKLYGNSLLCSYRIFLEEGPSRLWAGLVPRWLRIWASGGILFVVYEQSNSLFSRGLKETPFSWK